MYMKFLLVSVTKEKYEGIEENAQLLGHQAEMNLRDPFIVMGLTAEQWRMG